jgi:hypothetical protein
MLVGEDMHIYDGDKAHEAAWSIRQDNGITGDPLRIDWVGDHIFIEGEDGVWIYKAADGVPVGAIEPIGSKDHKPISPKHGSFVVLDKQRVAIAEQGYSLVTTYEADTGKRAKLVRKINKGPCKDADAQAYFKGDEVPEKCKAHMQKTYSHLQGADAVAGSKNLLVLLRGPRLGELAVLDAKSLSEKKTIKLPWCDEAASEDKAEKTDEKADKKAKSDDESEDE